MEMMKGCTKSFGSKVPQVSTTPREGLSYTGLDPCFVVFRCVFKRSSSSRSIGWAGIMEFCRAGIDIDVEDVVRFHLSAFPVA